MRTNCFRAVTEVVFDRVFLPSESEGNLGKGNLNVPQRYSGCDACRMGDEQVGVTPVVVVRVWVRLQASLTEGFDDIGRPKVGYFPRFYLIGGQGQVGSDLEGEGAAGN